MKLPRSIQSFDTREELDDYFDRQDDEFEAEAQRADDEASEPEEPEEPEPD